MVVGEVAEGIDLLVVGGGPGGYTAALHAARLGREVTLVDQAGEPGLGGVCLHTGCIPSKALIELAETVHRPARMATAGVAGALTADLTAFQSWSATLMEQLRAGIDGLMRQHKIRIMPGQLTFNKANRVAVATPDGNAAFLEFQSAIVATGSRPAELASLPVDGSRILTSADALALQRLPASMAVIGGGYIGVELGTAFAKLGCKVTIVELADRILPEFEPMIVTPVQRSLRRLGVSVMVSSTAVEVREHDLIAATGEKHHTVPAEVIVVSVGRRPNTDDLGLATAGVSVGSDGRVAVDDARLAARNIAAVGDITPGPAIAHKAIAEAEVAASAVSGRRAAFDAAAIPVVVFSDPEIAVVGLTEAEAREAGIDVVTGQAALAASGRARMLAAHDGLVRIVADREQQAVVGIQLAGPHVSELAGEAALAIEMMASPLDLAATIHPHPTISEALAAAAQTIIRPPLGAA
jgi:dihydrolipoamide dehydrogenase